MKTMYDSHVYEVATIIKLVCGLDIDAVYKTASNINKHIQPEDVDTLNNDCIYESYCNNIGDIL